MTKSSLNQTNSFDITKSWMRTNWICFQRGIWAGTQKRWRPQSLSTPPTAGLIFHWVIFLMPALLFKHYNYFIYFYLVIILLTTGTCNFSVFFFLLLIYLFLIQLIMVPRIKIIMGKVSENLLGCRGSRFITAYNRE